MRLHHDKVNVEQTESLESMEFGIRDKDMGFVLDILRTKMYKDPIIATCREVSCNSRDAHREVGTPDRPIEIWLPTELNKQIEFKDYGPGLSVRRIHEIVINYGASTKRDSNQQTGGLGIGFKSPFSVSNSFNIVTIHGGKKRHYTAFIDESRRGKLELNQEYETTDPNGTSIIVPVKENDFQRFAEAVIDTTKHWKVRPIVHSLPGSLAYPERKEPVLSGNDWELYEFGDSGYDKYDAKAKILIDGIAYEIAYNNLGINYYDDTPKGRWAKNILSKPIHISFKIGALSLASNRDNIHFDDRTQTLIFAKLNEIKATITELALKKVEEQENLAKAEIYWDDFTKQIAIDKKNAEPVWKGIKLTGLARKKNPDEAVIIHGYHLLHGGKMKMVSTGGLYLEKNLAIFVKDVDETDWALKRKVKFFLENNKGKGNVCVLRFINDEAKTRWYDELGLKHMDVNGTSTLPMPPKKTNTASNSSTGKRGPRRTTFDCWVYDPSYRGEKSYEHSWKPTTVEKDGGEGLYVVCKGKRDQEYDAGRLGIHSGTLRSLSELVEEDIYLIPEKEVAKLSDDWKRLDEVAIPMIEETLKEFSAEELSQLESASSYLAKEFLGQYQGCYNYVSGFDNDNDFDKDSLFVQYLKESKVIQTKYSDPAVGIRRNFGYLFESEKPMEKSKKSHPIKALAEKVKATYQMAFHISSYGITKEIVKQYIMMVDTVSKLNKDQSPKLKEEPSDEDPEETYCAVA